MLNLSMVEVKFKKEETKKKDSIFDYLSNPAPTMTSFIAKYDNSIRYNAIATDVTEKMQKGLYDLNSDYTIIYLYDVYRDNEGIDFISTYGGSLHTRSSANVTILTYYSPSNVKHWSNVSFRDKLSLEKAELYNVDRTVKALKDAYGVRSLPAMVITRKNKNGNESYVTIDLSHFDKDELYKVFKETIDVIVDNYEEDFFIIKERLVGASDEIRHNVMGDFNTYNYVYDLVKSEAKKLDHYNQLSLAQEMGISERNLRDKRRDNTFERDECFFIALRFEITIEELNELLRANNHQPIGLEGRDGVIRRCLVNQEEPYETDLLLKREGYAPLALKKKD